MASKFIWFDLVTTDLPAAKAFYSEIVGWKTTPFGGPQAYEVLNLSFGDNGVGGMQPGAQSRWVGYAHSDNVDAGVEQAKRLGGRILSPAQDIPGGVGRFAHIADPQGAEFYLFNPQPPPGKAPAAPAHRALGTFGWSELNTTDWKSAWKFYSELLGWQKQSSMDMGPEYGEYFMFGETSESAFGGMSNAATVSKQSPQWLHYIRVRSVDEAAKQIEKAGGKVVNGPMDVPGGDRILNAVDPQGALFALMSGQT